MNIIQAYELAKLGMVVIAPDGVQCRHIDFDRTDMFMHSYVFGEWRVKVEPVVFESRVETATRDGSGIIYHKEMTPLIGERVKVTVEVLDD